MSTAKAGPGFGNIWNVLVERVDNSIAWVLIKVIEAGVAVAFLLVPVAAVVVLWGFIRLIRWMWVTAMF
jgi:hypothetical protein